MGRRDHLLRIALAANQSQIEEPRTPTEEDTIENATAVAGKADKINRFDTAQGAILNAIGFRRDGSPKIDTDIDPEDLLSITSACQLVNYMLPLPLASQRNQILVAPENHRVNGRRFDRIILHISLCYEEAGELQVGLYYGSASLRL